MWRGGQQGEVACLQVTCSAAAGLPAAPIDAAVVAACSPSLVLSSSAASDPVAATTVYSANFLASTAAAISSLKTTDNSGEINVHVVNKGSVSEGPHLPSPPTAPLCQVGCSGGSGGAAVVSLNARLMKRMSEDLENVLVDRQAGAKRLKARWVLLSYISSLHIPSLSPSLCLH